MPTYQPELWNDEDGVQLNNNCYDYARDQQTGEFTQPGQNHGIVLEDEPYVCEAVGNAAETEGLRRVLADGECDRAAGCWKVALVIDPDPADSDFHWYRQDDDGSWSHKPGETPARNVDDSGQPIVDPQECDRGAYTEFCGFFCVCPVEGGRIGTMATRAQAAAPSAQLLLYSGRQNPSIALGPDQLREVSRRIEDLPPREQGPVGGLGYAGCVVRFGEAGLPGQAEEVRAFDGVVSVVRSGRASFFADDRELERWLLGLFRETDAWQAAVSRIRKTAAPGAVARGLLES